MNRCRCDGCGRDLPKGALRYSVAIEVKAAYDELEIGLLDLVRSHRGELQRLIEELDDADAAKLEEGIFKRMELDLCPACQQRFIAAPLRFNPREDVGPPPVDLDAFLRSLGYGPEGDESRQGDV